MRAAASWRRSRTARNWPNGPWAVRQPLADKGFWQLGETASRAELLQQRWWSRIEKKRASRPEQAIGSFLFLMSHALVFKDLRISLLPRNRGLSVNCPCSHICPILLSHSIAAWDTLSFILSLSLSTTSLRKTLLSHVLKVYGWDSGTAGTLAHLFDCLVWLRIDQARVIVSPR